MKRFALLGFLAVALCALLVTRPALADDTWVIHRGPILDQALADQRAGRFDLALQRLRYLLRSSPDAADEGYLLALQDQIRRESPWIVNGGGSFLPSTNIERASAHQFFQTSLGQLLIPDGGSPRFGVGIWLWGEAGRAWVTGPGQEVALTLGLARSVQPQAALSRIDLRLTLAHQTFSRWGHRRISLTALASRQDGEFSGQARADFDQLSLSMSATKYLGPKASLSGDLTLDMTRFPLRDHQTGPSMTAGIKFSRALDARTNLTMGIRFGRALPRAAHLANGFGALSLAVDRSFGENLVLGGTIELGGSHFDATFPTLAFARRDGHLALGLGISDNRIQVFGKVPTLNCTWRSARSNVALYEYQATDCQISLAVNF